MAEPEWGKLADAIHITENGHGLDKGEQYGIHSVHYRDEKEAREICIRTCRNKYKAWVKEGSKGDWLTYLAKRYCPVNWQIWRKNVNYFLKCQSSSLTVSVN